MAKKRKFKIDPVETPELGGVDKEILGKTVDDGVYSLAMAKEIRLDRIKPDKTQPRKQFDPERLEELAASIEEQGVLNPIGVQYVRDEDYFMIIHGERRWRAAKMIGLETIPALIKSLDEGDRLIHQLIENIQREDLNPVDRGKALKRLREELELTSWKAVGEKIGVSRVRVHQLLATTELPEKIQADLRSGVLSEKDARIYTGLPAHHQLALHEARMGGDLTDEELIETARILKDHPDRELTEVIQQLRKDEKSSQKSSTSKGAGGASFTAQSVVRFNNRLQRALPGLELDTLPETEQEELRESLKSLHALIGTLLRQLEG